MANIINYGSARWHRVTRSVIASEIHSLPQVFDVAYGIRNILEDILRDWEEIRTYMDSRSVIYVVTKRLKDGLEKFTDCQSWTEGVLRFWGAVKYGMVACILKPRGCSEKDLVRYQSPLTEFLDHNRLHFDPLGWETVATRKEHTVGVHNCYLLVNRSCEEGRAGCPRESGAY